MPRSCCKRSTCRVQTARDSCTRAPAVMFCVQCASIVWDVRMHRRGRRGKEKGRWGEWLERMKACPRGNVFGV
jgi:hypothetical protein